MTKSKKLILSCFILCFMCVSQAYADSRIKDIANFEGVRENMLVGYGLVVGLKGTGDSLRNSVFTKQSLQGMLQRMGIQANSSALQTKDIAAVMVTATLPPFPRQGERIDVTVSALGDATSLVGGQLLITPLLGADNNVYAVAQGALPVTSLAGNRSAITTTSVVSNGAIIEREIPFKLNSLQDFKISLKNPDFTTAERVSKAINSYVGLPVSHIMDPTTIEVKLPKSFKGKTADFITDIEQLPIQTDTPAKVVINEKTGVIVIGKNVRIDRVAIAEGNLTINIDDTQSDIPPLPFTNNGTVAETSNDNNKKLKKLPKGASIGIIRHGGVSLQDLVNGLNQMGISPANLIAILKSIKASGALQADIEVI